MSAPIIWIILPAVISSLLFSLRRWERIIYIAGILTAVILAILAWQLPIGEPISMRLWPGIPSLKVGDTLPVLGRQFLLENTSRPALIIIYVGIAFWFGGAYAANSSRLFIPTGLGIGALFTAALAVQPTLYAALIMEIAALISVPLLSPPGKPIRRGVLRFLVFQTIGMSFILFADLLIPVVETSGQSLTQTFLAAALMGMGFAIIIAVVPFHTWVPMLAEESHPYPAAFIFFVLPASVAFLSLNYISRFTQLGIGLPLYDALQTAGVLMIITGGVLAAFQHHLGRIMGFAATIQIGMALLAFSLGDETGLNILFLGIFFAQLLPQGLGLAIWGLALSLIRERANSLNFRDVKGFARQTPIASASLILANLSLAGLPLLASFPINIALWSALIQQSKSSALLALSGNAFLLIAGLRTMATLMMSQKGEKWSISERGIRIGLLVLGLITLFMIGLMPQQFLSSLINMAFIYSSGGQ